jgi:hypothetical protein
MTNRREFLHMGVAALSLPIAARAGVSPEMFGREKQVEAEPLYKIFFDERFAACTRFADEAKRRSMPVCAIRGDITEVWFSDLYYRWKEAPAAIAGMTAPGPIFCLEMLARDAGMRLVLRADHRWPTRQGAPDGRIEHKLAGPESVLRRAAGLETSAPSWPESMAELVAEFPREREAAAKANFTGTAPNENDSEHLVTWVLAPVHPA